MESFIHLRKGTTPRRLHADLDGLKDDELGRGGFTGRTANMYRRNDPTERAPVNWKLTHAVANPSQDRRQARCQAAELAACVCRTVVRDARMPTRYRYCC